MCRRKYTSTYLCFVVVSGRDVSVIALCTAPDWLTQLSTEFCVHEALCFVLCQNVIPSFVVLTFYSYVTFEAWEKVVASCSSAKSCNQRKFSSAPLDSCKNNCH